MFRGFGVVWGGLGVLGFGFTGLRGFFGCTFSRT